MGTKIVPYLKWAGGKRQIISELVKVLPDKYNTYYEPFLGAGALFFHLKRKEAVINDFNKELMMTYSAIRDNIDELLLLLHNYSEKNNSEDFYRIRELDRDREYYDDMACVEKAARLIYLNKTCYNGLYRVNSQGLFNTPFGNYRRPQICNESLLRAIHNYFTESNIVIRNQDFADSVSDAEKGDFVYFDPPYHSPNNSNFTGYQSAGFDENEQIRLKETLDDLTSKGVKCVLSNSRTNFIEELYRNYKIKAIKVPRMINCDGKNRGAVDEVIVKNW